MSNAILILEDISSSGVKECQKELKQMVISNESTVESYCKIKLKIQNLKFERQAFLTRPIYIIPFLQPGRLVNVSHWRFKHLQLIAVNPLRPKMTIPSCWKTKALPMQCT